jgi:hypothetical protein
MLSLSERSSVIKKPDCQLRKGKILSNAYNRRPNNSTWKHSPLRPGWNFQ